MILGDHIPAGQGQALVRPDLDFETYSEAGYVWNAERNRWDGPDGAPGTTKGLPVIGAYNSIKHPSFEIVWLAYDLKDGAGRRQWRPGQPAPADLLGYLACGGEIEAWNVAYERWVWELYCVPALGWPAVREEQWFCAMAKARAFSLPGQLGKAGEVLALDVQKDKAGGALMKRLSMPVNPTAADPRTRILPAYDDAGVLRNANHIVEGLRAVHPDATPRRMAGFAPKALAIAAQDAADTRAYGDYNLTDIEAESAVSARVPELVGDELTWWRVHERINRRGVHIDRASVENCIAIVEQAFARYNGELVALCGVDAASKVQQLQAWLRGRGTHLDSLDEEHVEGALANPLLPPDVRRVLQIRAAVGSASIKKLYAIRNRLCDDDRLRDLYVYHGARTGRSTGEGPQPTNLPKAGPDMLRCACTQHYGQHLHACPFCGAARPADAKPNEWNPTMAEQALAVMSTRSLEWAEHVYGQALQTIAGCLRAMFDAAPGHDLLSTDYNSIEAVGLAMLAGEQWRIDVFNTHGKIYEASASTMFGIPLDEILAVKKTTGQHHHLRQTGKVAELACLAGDTQVLTPRGYVWIRDIQLDDEVWDGKAWVKHAGVVFKGTRRTIDLGGARMTPEHLVLCGTSWQEASQLVSPGSTRTLALATGSENLPSLASPPKGTASSSLAVAGNPLTRSHSETCERGGPLVAQSAPDGRAGPRSSCISSTPLSSPTTSTAADCSAGLPRRSAGATEPQTPGSRTMAPAGFTCTRSGARTKAYSCATLSLCLGGTTPPSKWIDGTSTEGTSRETSGSSLDPKTCKTAEASPNCSGESSTLRDVYDIAHAGPRNRFTIRTSEGHLVVHNCGYQGWLGAAMAFGMPGTDDEIKDRILAWRAASPTIEWLWGGQTAGKAGGILRNAQRPDYAGSVADWLAPVAAADRWDRGAYYFGVEGMATLAVLEPDRWHAVYRMNGTDSGIAYRCDGDTLTCRLPSGRLLTYHRVRLVPSDRGGWSMSYEGWNTNPKNGPPGWIRMNTWGGRLVENIVQATCREILRAACIVLERAGYPVVLHVYDEIVSEVPEGVGTIEEFETLVTEGIRPLIPWAADWPIRAPGGYRAKRYRKG